VLKNNSRLKLNNLLNLCFKLIGRNELQLIRLPIQNLFKIIWKLIRNLILINKKIILKFTLLDKLFLRDKIISNLIVF
jgi:hypothetical protein